MKHTESAGGVVVNKDGHVLVVNQNHDSWSLPKGHIDPGEDALTAAKREIAEEAGIRDLQLVEALGSYTRPKIRPQGVAGDEELKTIHMFFFRTGQMELKPEDPRNPIARWVPKEKVAELLTHPKDGAFFLSVLQKI